MPRTVNEVVHIAWPGAFAGETNAQEVLRDCIAPRDSLCEGPCDSDPERHLAKRQVFLGLSRRELSLDIINAIQLGHVLGRYPDQKPVVLWSGPTWSLRLFSWWVLDAILRLELDPGRFWIAELPPAQWSGCYVASDRRKAWASLTPLRARFLRAGASLWRKFAAPSPLAFDRARRDGVTAFPDLAELAECWGRSFPRPAQGGSLLRLSATDQALFNRLSPSRWVRPCDLVCDRDLMDVLSPLADGYVRHRVREWVAHPGEEPPLRTRELPTGLNEFTRVAYRLTATGVRVRDKGLRSPGEAPLAWIGGCRLYDARETWVRHDLRQGEWRVGRL
jgi:hypothetical protein